jgi:hypothetical protein
MSNALTIHTTELSSTGGYLMLNSWRFRIAVVCALTGWIVGAVGVLPLLTSPLTIDHGMTLAQLDQCMELIQVSWALYVASLLLIGSAYIRSVVSKKVDQTILDAYGGSFQQR